MAIFVDESNKDRVAARRKYGWSRKGTRVNYRALFNMDTRYTFIGAVADRFCTYIEQYLYRGITNAASLIALLLWIIAASI